MHKILPKYYHFIDELNFNKIKYLNKKIALIYRNYEKKINLKELKIFKNNCKKNRKILLISNYPEIALKYQLNGLYIPSFNKKQININLKYKKNFLIIGSAHNLKEIREKERQNVQQIFISPIFKSKKNNKFLGIYEFNKLSKYTKKKTIALGGINYSNKKLLKLCKCDGFAAINYFKDLNFDGK